MNAGDPDKPLGSVGPFSFTARCVLDTTVPAPDEYDGSIIIRTTENDSAMESDDDDDDFNTPDSRDAVGPTDTAINTNAVYSEESEGWAIAPSGFAVDLRLEASNNTLNDDLAEAPDCVFNGYIMQTS